MALAGVHICFSNVGTITLAGQLLPDSGETLAQTMPSAGTSTISGQVGQQLLSISASAPIFYAVGQSPDVSGSSSTRRYYDPATGREDLFCHIGDRVAWAFA